MSTSIILPSQVKIDVQKIFNLCEDRWGSNGLLALVVYGSATKMKYKEISEKHQFLWWKWEETKQVRVEPNDVDVAVIYSRVIPQNKINIEGSCRILDRVCDAYSTYWVDSTKFANIHAMCIDYNTLVENKNTDENLQSVLQDGILVWGDLPRPMKTLK